VTIVVDASAVVAIALNEPERDAFLARLDHAAEAFITPVNWIEAGLAIVVRHRLLGLDEFAAWTASQLGLTEMGVDGEAALRAYVAFGRGAHRARLTLGDCFAYALAKKLDAPLLFKGSDFALTDVRPALQPT
jgi:ribonuclease VapC